MQNSMVFEFTYKSWSQSTIVLLLINAYACEILKDGIQSYSCIFNFESVKKGTCTLYLTSMRKGTLYVVCINDGLYYCIMAGRKISFFILLTLLHCPAECRTLSDVSVCKIEKEKSLSPVG